MTAKLTMAVWAPPRRAFCSSWGGVCSLLTVVVIAFALLCCSAPRAFGDQIISPSGEGAGQTRWPTGAAVDFSTGTLYVADRKNNRLSIFDAAGVFVKAVGWGVRNGANEFQECTSATKCRAGLPGGGRGQFGEPISVAVDNDPASPSYRAVYVTDSANYRVQKFDSDGHFLLMFGGGVNHTKVAEGAPVTDQNVCPVAPDDICGTGVQGFTEGQFNQNIGTGSPLTEILVSVGTAGTVFVADSYTPPTPGQASYKARVQRFTPEGTADGPQLVNEEGYVIALAADSNTGEFYIYAGRSYFPGIQHRVLKFDPAGSVVGETLLSIGADVLGVDESSNLFVGLSDESILEVNPSGEYARRFGYGAFLAPITAIAPFGGGTYVGEREEIGGGDRVLHLDYPAPGPIVFPEACKPNPNGNGKATLVAEVNPEGKETTARFQYVERTSYESEGGFSSPNVKETEDSDPFGPDFDLHKVAVQADVVPETEYACRAVAANADGTGEGEVGFFKSLPPLEIGPTWASGVGTEEATLNAEVNPLGIPTSGFFEYVDAATYAKDVEELGPEHGFDHAKKAPAPAEPIEFGALSEFKAGAATIAGLEPATSYRYRIVATDVLISPDPPPNEVFGPTKTLRTYAQGAGTLPDGRAFELVSPGQKNSAEVAVVDLAGGVYLQENSGRIQASSGTGEAVTYTSFTSFGEAEGAPSSSQYLSKRTASGWITENVSPKGFIKDPVQPPYRGFTPDLGFGAFYTDEPALTPEAQEGNLNLYLRDGRDGSVQALTTEKPTLVANQGFCTGFAGASAEGSRAFFAARGAMAGAPAGEGFSLYEWSAKDGLGLVSVLPDGNPAPPVSASLTLGSGTGFGALGSTCSMGQGIAKNAVSEDGSIAFWKYGGKYLTSEQPLFARIGGEETIQLDAKEAEAKGPSGQGRFWAATPDGSRAFFTAPGRLTVDAKGEGRLYRYDTQARVLTDLTPGKAAPEVQGVIGASDNGEYLYFVGKGALTGEEESPAGQKAQAGSNNLYLWHEGEGLRFIATLSGRDESSWSSVPTGTNGLRGRVTPDGRHLGFLSVETQALAGYDNRRSPGGGCEPIEHNKVGGNNSLCAEAFLYSAEGDELTCVSCDPSGARPVGPAELPSWSNPLEGPRFLSDDGSRFYFESRDPLSSADENGGVRDVYEYEALGKGSCTAQDPGFDPASGGCVSLLSGGRSEDHAYLVDASADGRDVFISTRANLTGWDKNHNYDVYDIRSGGGFPEPQEAPSCEGEGCKPPVSALPPAAPSPGTASFEGPGNAKQKAKKKHKAKRKHRVRHKGKRHAHRAHHHREAAR